MSTTLLPSLPTAMRFRPCVVIDLETTGLLRNVDLPNDPWGNARIIEIGAVLVSAAMKITDARGGLVLQPAEHLHSQMARQTEAVHKITAEMVLARGIEEADVVERFCSWLLKARETHSPGRPLHLRAWNQGFETRMLARGAWGEALAPLLSAGIITWGEDCMRTAIGWLRQLGLNELGGKRLGGSVSLERVAAYLRRPYSRHRALADARLTAEVIIHIEQHRQASPPARQPTETTESLLTLAETCAAALRPHTRIHHYGGRAYPCRLPHRPGGWVRLLEDIQLGNTLYLTGTLAQLYESAEVYFNAPLNGSRLPPHWCYRFRFLDHLLPGQPDDLSDSGFREWVHRRTMDEDMAHRLKKSWLDWAICLQAELGITRPDQLTQRLILLDGVIVRIPGEVVALTSAPDGVTP